MYCKYCKVNVNTSKNVCPLCHNKLEGAPLETPVYVPRESRKARLHLSFKLVYSFIAACIFLMCLVINCLVKSPYWWSFVVLAITVWVYYLVNHTIRSKNTGGYKIYIQTITMSLFAIVIQYVFHTNEWAFSYALPIIVISTLGFQLLFISIFNKKPNHFLRYMVYTSVIGFLPIILYYCNVFEFRYLADSSAILSAIVLLGIFVFGRKTFIEDFKKNSHL